MNKVVIGFECKHLFLLAASDSKPFVDYISVWWFVWACFKLSCKIKLSTL